VGKASRRKRRAPEGKEPKRSFPKRKDFPSILAGRYGVAFALVLIITTGILIYSGTFHSPFLWDDEDYILDNPWIRDPGNLFDTSDTRYVAYLTFALNYLIGGYNPLGYHLVNITIHIINGLLVLWVVYLTFKTPVMERAAFNPQLKGLVSLTCALIFISHPVQTQAVTYITQRFASLATLFFLLSLGLFVKWRISRGTFRPIPRAVIYSVSVLSAVLAMKTKEISFTLPFIIVLYEFTFFNDKTLRERVFPLIPLLLTSALIPFTLFSPELGLGERTPGIDETIRARKIEDFVTLSPHDYLITQFGVIVTYIRLLILPLNQNLDYDYPLYKSFFEPGVFFSFLFLFSVFGLAIYLFKRSRKTGSGYALLASFGILWFFITLSVESSIIPIRDVIYEHRVYLPSVGAVLAFSTLPFYLLDRRKTKTPPLVATSLLLLFTAAPLGIAAYARNLVWTDEVTIWEDVVEKSPGKARVHYNLGNAYDKQDRREKAIEEYRKAITIEPDYPMAHNNLGLAYWKKGQYDRAIEEYKTALKLRPDFAKAHNNLGIVYNKQGKTNAAIEEYKEAIRLKPDYVSAHFNLGVAYAIKGLNEAAKRELEEVIRIRPDYELAHKALRTLSR
jgi:tetratricopeptide (TPR) repeat protein